MIAIYCIRRIKDKKRVIMSVEAKKHLTKSNTLSLQVTQQAGNRRGLPQSDKGHLVENYS